jgi:hypothetical protein
VYCISILCMFHMYFTVQPMKSYTHDTDADQLCTSTNRLVQSLQTNKHCNGRGLSLNLFIRPRGGGGVEANPDWTAVVEWFEPGTLARKSQWPTTQRLWDSSARSRPKLWNVIFFLRGNKYTLYGSNARFRFLCTASGDSWWLRCPVIVMADKLGFQKKSQINTQHIAASSVHLTKSVSVECEYSLLLTQRYLHAPRDLALYFVKFFWILSCCHV